VQQPGIAGPKHPEGETMSTDQTTGSISGDDTTEQVDPGGFTPDYAVAEGVRIHRAKIYKGSGGTATVTFRGQIDDATRDLTVRAANGGSGRPSIYAEVVTDDSSATTVKVAIVPTGKRVPLTADGDRAFRLGTVQRGSRFEHVYLLEVDGTADRAAYDAEQQKRRAARAAKRAEAQQTASLLLVGFGSISGEDDDDSDTE
jgi:hypothetical protein